MAARALEHSNGLDMPAFPKEAKAIPYAQQWAELNPSNEKAEMVMRECQEELVKKGSKQRETF